MLGGPTLRDKYSSRNQWTYRFSPTSFSKQNKSKGNQSSATASGTNYRRSVDAWAEGELDRPDPGSPLSIQSATDYHAKHCTSGRTMVQDLPQRHHLRFEGLEDFRPGARNNGEGEQRGELRIRTSCNVHRQNRAGTLQLHHAGCTERDLSGREVPPRWAFCSSQPRIPPRKACLRPGL